MSYEFRGLAFRTASAMCDAIAFEFITAGGTHSLNTIIDELRFNDDRDLVDACMSRFGIDEVWMRERRVTYDDLLESFVFLRNRFHPVMRFNFDTPQKEN